MTIELLGCTHESLASYLKSIAVLRLISQADTHARGFWGSRSFVIESKFDEEGLIRFFLEDYRPTPALAPWNGGSGFYDKDRKIGINAVLGTKHPRFATYRADLMQARRIVKAVGPLPDEDERRTMILRLCRNELSDECVDWLDAAIAISSEEVRAFAPILGTGGNEGRLDYTNNFMERLNDLLIAPDRKTPVRELLVNALCGTFSNGLRSIAVGQYDPGRAGGFNQGEKIEADSFANPWDTLLTLEGAAAWAGGIYRKQGVSYRSFLCSPFTVRPSAVGYGSASTGEEANSRAEIWTPLWSQPARFREIQSLLREGRAAIDGKPAKNGMDFAQAAGLLGVDRGLDAFVRFSLLKRRGDSYIALRVGRFAAEYRRGADLIRELNPLIEAAAQAARGDSGDAPNSWSPLERAMEEAMFQALLHDREDLLLSVAAAFGAMHRWLLLRGRKPRWRVRLSENWVGALWSKPEARIAAALASIWSDQAGALIENVAPDELRYSWLGRDLTARMLATLKRRSLEGAGADQSPFASKLRAKKSDVIGFLEGALDENLIEDLMFAFLLAKFPDWPNVKNLFPEADDARPWLRWPAYSLLKQFFSEATHPNTYASPGEPRFRADPAMASWLEGGSVERPLRVAIQRLKIGGLQPGVSRAWGNENALRVGAALLIPVEGVADLQTAIIRESLEV